MIVFEANDGALLFGEPSREANGDQAVAETVYRPARLFRAGDYPDKSLAVTEADIDAMIARFAASGGRVPLKVEHIDSPLDPLGHLVALYRSGAELYGMLALPSDIAEVLRRRGIEKLSVGLSREPLSLAEVSIVARPRIRDAALLSATTAGVERASVWLSRGKLTPATAPIAARLLSVPVAFGQGIDIAAEVEALLSALPVVQPKGAAVPRPFRQEAGDSGEVSPAALALAKRLGIRAEDLARKHREIKDQKYLGKEAR